MNLKSTTKTLGAAERELAKAQKAASRAAERASKSFARLSKAPTLARYKSYCKAASAESDTRCKAAWFELQLNAAVRAAEGRKRSKAKRVLIVSAGRKKTRKRAKKATRKKAAPKKKKEPRGGVTLQHRIERAAQAINPKRRTRIRLRELRRKLVGVSRRAVDDALLDGQDAGRWVLYRDDVTRNLTDADRAAALMVGDNPRHLLLLE